MVCRLCFTESDEYIEIFSELKISNNISKFLDLEITENDVFSKVICISCWQQLNNFQTFYMRVKEAQRKTQIKLKKEPSLIEIESEQIEESAFEYINTETDTDVHKNTKELESSTTVEEEKLAEHIVPDNNDTQATPIPCHGKSLKRRSRHFKKMAKPARSFKSEEERKCFVELMKREEVIWNRTNQLHSHQGALVEGWIRIASSMPTKKTVSECKVMWKSLRDALRYEKRRADSGIDQGDEIRNLLSFVSPTYGQKNKKTQVNALEKETGDVRSQRKRTKHLYTEIESAESIDNSQDIPIKASQIRQAFESSNHASWSERTGEGSLSEFSTYSERPSNIIPSNMSFEAPIEKPNNNTRVTNIPSTTVSNAYMNNLPRPPSPILYKSTPNSSYCEIKNEFKDEVTDLVDSISKALNRLVNIATTQVQQVKPSHTEFKHEYIWKLIECLYLQMDQLTINDLNQKIINMVYESCKTSARMY